MHDGEEWPVGAALSGWRPRGWPPRTTMVGRYCRLEPFDPERHAEELHAANQLDSEGVNWTYLPYGPFEDLEAYQRWVQEVSVTEDPLFFGIVDPFGDRLDERPTSAIPDPLA